MNIARELQHKYSKVLCDRMVRYIDTDKARFAELVTVFLAGPYRTTQRAAGVVSACVEHHPGLITPHLKKILRHAQQPGQHDAVMRNTLRLLQFIRLPVSLQGEVTEMCFRLLADSSRPVAIRAFAITVLTETAKQLPDLKNELIPLIEQRLPYEKPAFLARGNRALKALRKS